MNIVLINHYAGSLDYGMEYRPFYMAKEWNKLGHQTAVVAASYSHVRRRSPIIAGSQEAEEIENIRYHWFRTCTYNGNGMRRVLNMLGFILQLFRHGKLIAEKYRPELVIASSTYPLDIYPSFRLAKSCHAKLVYEVHDLWPLSPKELAGMSDMHPFILMMQHAENFAYRNSDAVVSMLPCAREHMQAHGLQLEKYVYIPNGVVIDDWNSPRVALPQQHAAALAKLKNAGSFVVGYAGSHGLANALDAVLVSAKLLRDQNVSFLLVGDGPAKERLKQQAADQGLDNIVFLPNIRKAAIPTLLEEFDLCYLGFRRCSLFRFGVSPNKLFDYMMAGRPIVQAVEAGNDIVTESECGVTIPPEEPQSLAKAIMRMKSLSPHERQLMGQNGRQYVTSRHDYRLLAKQFLASIDN